MGIDNNILCRTLDFELYLYSTFVSELTLILQVEQRDVIVDRLDTEGINKARGLVRGVAYLSESMSLSVGDAMLEDGVGASQRFLVSRVTVVTCSDFWL